MTPGGPRLVVWTIQHLYGPLSSPWALVNDHAPGNKCHILLDVFGLQEEAGEVGDQAESKSEGSMFGIELTPLLLPGKP